MFLSRVIARGDLEIAFFLVIPSGGEDACLLHPIIGRNLLLPFSAHLHLRWGRRARSVCGGARGGGRRIGTFSRCNEVVEKWKEWE